MVPRFSLKDETIVKFKLISWSGGEGEAEVESVESFCSPQFNFSIRRIHKCLPKLRIISPQNYTFPLSSSWNHSQVSRSLCVDFVERNRLKYARQLCWTCQCFKITLMASTAASSSSRATTICYSELNPRFRMRIDHFTQFIETPISDSKVPPFVLASFLINYHFPLFEFIQIPIARRKKAINLCSEQTSTSARQWKPSKASP